MQESTIGIPREPRSLCCRVTLGLRVISIIEAFFLGLSLALNVVFLINGHPLVLLSIIVVIGFIVVVARMYQSGKEERAPGGVLPYIILKSILLSMQLLGIFGIVVCTM